MTLGFAMIALASGALPVATLHPGARIELTGRIIRVADVASLFGADAATRARLSRQIVASLPEGRRGLTLSRSAVASLLRRAVPGLEIADSDASDVVQFHAPAMPAAARPTTGCFALSHAVSRGAPLTLDDVGPVACDAQGERTPILFDRRGAVVRAEGDLPEHSYLGRIALPQQRGVDRGDRLTLRSVVGPVRIERPVVALQAGQGRRIFVRDEDGHTIAAPLAGLDEETAQ